MHRFALAIAGWLAAAGVAVAVGLVAVSLLTSGLSGPRVEPLSKGRVASELATSSTSASPTPTGSPGHSGHESVSRTKVLHSRGGTAVVGCREQKAYLISWTPAQGFEAEEQRRGPARSVYADFESDELEVRITARCKHGVPVKDIRTEDD